MKTELKLSIYGEALKEPNLHILSSVFIVLDLNRIREVNTTVKQQNI